MTTLVFDASAAVKWFRPFETDSARSRQMLGESSERAWLPDHCAHEVINAVFRRGAAVDGSDAWIEIGKAGVTVAHADLELVTEALRVAEELQCDYYDALAPALARLLGGTLVSADRRAHAAVPGAIILG